MKNIIQISLIFIALNIYNTKDFNANNDTKTILENIKLNYLQIGDYFYNTNNYSLFVDTLIYRIKLKKNEFNEILDHLQLMFADIETDYNKKIVILKNYIRFYFFLSKLFFFDDGDLNSDLFNTLNSFNNYLNNDDNLRDITKTQLFILKNIIFLKKLVKQFIQKIYLDLKIQYNFLVLINNLKYELQNNNLKKLSLIGLNSILSDQVSKLKNDKSAIFSNSELLNAYLEDILVNNFYDILNN